MLLRAAFKKILIALALLTIQTPLPADTLLAQFTLPLDTTFICCTTTSDVDLYAAFSYGLSSDFLQSALVTNALLSSTYDFNAFDSPDFNAVTRFLTDGINQEPFVGFLLIPKTGGRYIAGSGFSDSEFKLLSGCVQTPHPPECDKPGIGPDLVGNQISSIRVLISDLIFQNAGTPPSTGVEYSATVTWMFFGTGTPLPSAIPEPESVHLMLVGIGVGVCALCGRFRTWRFHRFD